MAEQRRYKSINFDLDTHRLTEIFGKTGRRKAYAQIMSFMLQQDFDHRQWSGYVSHTRRTYLEIYAMIDDPLIMHPWLSYCANRFDITDFMAQSDAMDYIMMKQERAGATGLEALAIEG